MMAATNGYTASHRLERPQHRRGRAVVQGVQGLMRPIAAFGPQRLLDGRDAVLAEDAVDRRAIRGEGKLRQGLSADGDRGGAWR